MGSKAKVHKLEKKGSALEQARQSRPCHWKIAGDKAHCDVHDHDRRVIRGKLVDATITDPPRGPSLRERVLAYIKAHHGKKVDWKAFRKEMRASHQDLGVAVRALLDDGAITEGPQFVYRLARPKALRRAA